MISPITGKVMSLTKERRLVEFRKEKLEIVFHYYLCEESGEQFTTTKLDEVNLNQVHHKYREKFNIPFPEEIIRIREKYGLSAARMSEILGFGINSYRQYESGDMPSVANAKLIQMMEDPIKFIDMVEICGTLEEKLKAKFIQNARQIIDDTNRSNIFINLESYLLGSHFADIYSGYKKPNLKKFAEMVIFFSEQMAPFKTKMNKLLFYSDFLMFKQSCVSISGMRYKAINMGPVPNNYQSIFEYLANNGTIEIFMTEFSNGYVGEQFKPKNGRRFNQALFSEQELAILNQVFSFFKDTSTSGIIQQSHFEEGWIKNEKDKNIISYEYAFELSLN